AQLARRGDAHELGRHFADARLQPRFARLPAEAAEPVELDMRLLIAVARKQFEVFDRQEQPGAARIMNLEAIMRRAERLDRFQTGEAADAVVDVDDDVARGKARELGDEIVGAALAATRARETVAEDVLLGDERDVAALEAGLEPEDGEAESALR